MVVFNDLADLLMQITRGCVRFSPCFWLLCCFGVVSYARWTGRSAKRAKLMRMNDDPVAQFAYFSPLVSLVVKGDVGADIVFGNFFEQGFRQQREFLKGLFQCGNVRQQSQSIARLIALDKRGFGAF